MVKVQVTVGYKIHHSYSIQAAIHLGGRKLLRMIKSQVCPAVSSLTVCMIYLKVHSL